MEHLLGKVRHAPVTAGEFLCGPLHEGAGRIERPVALQRLPGGAAAMDFPRTEDEHAARANPLCCVSLTRRATALLAALPNRW
jgi:hypothetical protein